MKLTGNKGEWSELYAFIKLLSTGKLYAADEKVNRINNIFFPILKIIRNEDTNTHTEYVICSDKNLIEIHLNSEMIKEIPQNLLVRLASYLYHSIVSGSNRAFQIDNSDEIMSFIDCKKISAPSTDKTDITMQIHDIHTGYEPICGFSIKSELGSAPTLLNASKATNFMFEIKGVTDSQADYINSISSKTKILDRIEKISEFGTMDYVSLKNKNFEGNLMLIDTYMDNILSDILLDSYQNNISNCKLLIERLESRNPLGYPRKGLYEFKFKKFLCSIALGMMPSKAWDGNDEANGGYIIVKQDGDVLAYHIYNRDSFEIYLLNNTKLERGSTSKHDFASIYKENDKMYINLNLQIRFI